MVIILFSIYQSSFGQEKNNFLNHQFSVDLGSFRNRYLYPITDISYGSPVLEKVNLKFSARLRSYGTLFFYSKSAYDFTPLSEYYFTKTIKPIYFSAGIGLDTRIRMINDDRSQAASSAEPLISIAIHGNYKTLSFNTPLWTRFYSNGISFTLLPEASFRIGKRVSIFIRYELSYLAIYKTSTHEWRQDNFIGTHIDF
ncbi:MAG: hypothetical protein HY840_14630 [Bacteroidetes bacterium]|nr:hypothetical protein [Bacteroidota bacterium]